MIFGNESSAFWFYGRLHPGQRVPNFDVQEVVISEIVRLELIRDGIGVWSRPGARYFKQPGEATELFRLVVAAYALVSGEALDVTLDGWIEATEAKLDGAVLGFRVERSLYASEVDAPRSEQMRAAAELAIRVRQSPNLRLAIRDIYAALQDPTTSDDAFLFAFRAVEDCARALTGSDDEANRVDWASFHQELGRSPDEGKERLDPLTRARNAVAHGDVATSDLAEPRGKRSELIDLARATVIETLKIKPGVDLSDLLTGSVSEPQ